MDSTLTTFVCGLMAVKVLKIDPGSGGVCLPCQSKVNHC